MGSDAQWILRPVVPADEASWRRLYRGYRRFYEMPDDEAAVDAIRAWLATDG